MKKMKALRPSLREKKRYTVFEVLAKKKVKNFKSVVKAIHCSYKELFGTVGLARAGLIILSEENAQKGVIRVNNKFLDHLRAALANIEQVEEENVIVRSVGVSGILKKAKVKYLAA